VEEVMPAVRETLKPVILGMNSKTGEALGLLPTTGAGARLWRCTGLTLREYLNSFDRMNLLEEPEWNAHGARDASKKIRHRLSGRMVIVLGSQAWTVLSLPKRLPFDEAFSVDGTRWHMIPHPSGKNLWYNDPKNREKVRDFFAQFRR
jgi:hypothetical protein